MKDEIEKTKVDLFTKCLDFARKNQQISGEKNDYFITLKQLNDILKGSCPCECGYQCPYGFVPEAGCPVHD